MNVSNSNPLTVLANERKFIHSKTGKIQFIVFGVFATRLFVYSPLKWLLIRLPDDARTSAV